MKFRIGRNTTLAVITAMLLAGCSGKQIIETVPKIITPAVQRGMCHQECPKTPFEVNSLCLLACDRAACLECGASGPGETIACWKDNGMFAACCTPGGPEPGIDPRGYCGDLSTPTPALPPRPRPSDPTATTTATATATATPTATSAPMIAPPPFALSNGGSGFLDKNGEPEFTEVKPDLHLIKIDFTWWFYMGEEWRDRYACGGPNNNSSPCWSGGINSPCDPGHSLAFNGPCHGREWGPKAPGTIVTLSGPGYVPDSLALDDKNPFADVWFKYNPGHLPIHARYCPPADMKDAATGLVISIKGWFSASGCREVDFITPKE